MLKSANVTIKLGDGTEKKVTLGEAYNAFVASVTKGGERPFEIFTYRPGTKKFGFQRPAYFTPKHDRLALIGVEIELPSGQTYGVITDGVTKVLATATKANNHITALPLAALQHFRGQQVKIAYLDDDGTVILCPVKRVFDPVDEINKANTAEVDKAKAENRKAEVRELPRIDGGDVVILESNDGAFVVCDRLFMS